MSTSLSSTNRVYNGYKLEGYSYTFFIYDLEDINGNRKYEVNIFTSARHEVIRFDDIYYNCDDEALKLLYSYCNNIHKSMQCYENEENTDNVIYRYIKIVIDNLAFHYRSVYAYMAVQQKTE